MTDHRFQVDLRGIIDLLANHLYSSPRVFVRELLQNSVDAIRARQAIEPEHRGLVEIEITPGHADSPPTLAFEDDGIGLDEEEVHQFLATIGLSSKKGRIDALRGSFIGQFGIGLLSCFMVADEIVMITRSARPGQPTLEWKGRENGTYGLRRLESEIAPGTRVYLRARADRASLFGTGSIEKLVRHYGDLLPVPVRLRLPAGARPLNRGEIPWRGPFSSDLTRDAELRELCRELFEFEPMECISLRSADGDVDGVAFVQPGEVSPSALAESRVYLKGMLLSETSDSLLPPWSVFAKCVVNAEDLRPTASRESFFEDERLERARHALGRGIKRHLVRLAERSPERLRRLVAVHLLSMKALAVADDEFFPIAMRFIPFETSGGLMTMAEYRERYDEVLYVSRVGEFHQISALAAAQDICVVNGGLTYCEELLRRLGHENPDLPVRGLHLGDVVSTFEPATDDDRARMSRLLGLARDVLAAHRCQVEARRFAPSRLPVVLVLDSRSGFLRAVEKSKEAADDLWSSVMDNVAAGKGTGEAVLCFNLANPLIERLLVARDDRVLGRAVEMLYIHGLLLGQYPLRASEIELLSSRLLELVELAVDATEGHGA